MTIHLLCHRCNTLFSTAGGTLRDVLAGITYRRTPLRCAPPCVTGQVLHKSFPHAFHSRTSTLCLLEIVQRFARSSNLRRVVHAKFAITRKAVDDVPICLIACFERGCYNSSHTATEPTYPVGHLARRSLPVELGLDTVVNKKHISRRSVILSAEDQSSSAITHA